MTGLASLPVLGWSTFATTWRLAPWWTLFAVLALAAYVVGLRTCRTAGVRPVSSVRVGCFVAGLVLLVVTMSSAIGVYAMALMWVHMVEHLMLIMVVPALLVLGHPLTVLRAAAATRGRERRVDDLLRSGPVALLTHPVVALFVYGVVIVATHLTSFMDAMATHGWLMGAEQVLYVASGYLFLLPLIGEEPIRWRMPQLARVGLVLLAMTPDTVVGIVMLQSDHDMYPVMTSMRPPWALPAVQDIQAAGGLMWAAGDGLMMLIGVGVTIALIARPASTNIIGARLEGVRRATLAAQVSRGEVEPARFGSEVDVDDDEEMLAAYNRMLGRLNGPDHGSPRG